MAGLMKRRICKLEMKFKDFGRRIAPRRTESLTALIRNNNNKDVQDGYERQVHDHSGALIQNSFNIQNEQHLQSDDNAPSAEHLRVPADSISVQHLPDPPEDLDKNLHQHLSNVQKMLVPLHDSRGTDLHHQMITQLEGVSQKITSCKSCFILLQWLLQIYLSHDLLGHPDFKDMDLIKKIDLMLLTDCIKKTEEKLRDLVKKEVSMTLEKILSKSRERGSKSDEDLNEIYIDTIQCTDAMPKQASKISLSLSVQVQEICLEELLDFVRRYRTQQTEFLAKSKMTKIDTFDFFKTLKTCRELKRYIQTKHDAVKVSLLKETVVLLEEMQDFTVKLLLENVADVTETHLIKYFAPDCKQFFLVGALKKLFPNPSCLEEQKCVMDEVYKLTVHLYLKHLINTKKKKLVKCWSQNIGDIVAEDAELIHNTFSDLAPDVQQWNFTLLEISNVLRCKEADALKITVAGMKKECINRGCTEDLELLPALLRWKGLSKREVRDILEALPDQEPKSRPASCFCFLIPNRSKEDQQQ